jgi:hypothetical protein
VVCEQYWFSRLAIIKNKMTAFEEEKVRRVIEDLNKVIKRHNLLVRRYKKDDGPDEFCFLIQPEGLVLPIENIFPLC